jgi:nitrile hydratase beta subunit
VTVRPQDLGGRRGFGQVPIERDEPVFHAHWEASVIAGILATIAAGLYNVDQFREGIDDLEPLSYLSLGYYGRWLHTLEVNCVRSGVFSDDELERRIEELASGVETPAGPNREIAEQLRDLIYFSAPALEPAPAPPAFAVGDRVSGRVLDGRRHARIPVYAQGRTGVIHHVLPAFPEPDANRLGLGERPEHVYSVLFAARDLWDDGDARAEIILDLWESYLEAAPENGAA